MTFVDVLIVLFAVSAAVRWSHYGLVRGIFSLGGFWAGFLLGAVFVPRVIQFASDPFLKLTIALLMVFGAASLVGNVGRAVGQHLYSALYRVKLSKLDSILGAVFGIFMILVIAWLAAAIMSATPSRELNRQINRSAILSAMNHTLPPAPSILSRIATLVSPYSFPQVFIGQEPRPIAPVEPPSSEEVAAAIKAAGRSTVRIESLGCGGQVFGSGFVASDGLVMTNAHVVAGIDNPRVVDASGEHRAQVIYFDPDMDLAILRTSGLSGPPLAISSDLVSRGTAAVVLGYPGGGPLEGDAAGVLERVSARGRNIYGRGVATRSVYALQTSIESGNSGGPTVLPDGTVIGVVFARAQTDDTGYAITSDQVLRALRAAQSSDPAVDTGECA